MQQSINMDAEDFIIFKRVPTPIIVDEDLIEDDEHLILGVGGPA